MRAVIKNYLLKYSRENVENVPKKNIFELFFYCISFYDSKKNFCVTDGHRQIIVLNSEFRVSG